MKMFATSSNAIAATYLAIIQCGSVMAVLLTSLIFLTLHGNAAVKIVPQAEGKSPRSWPMFGGSPGRNMVNDVERNLPADWNAQEGKLKNIKWIADLGGNSLGSPIIANGTVYFATHHRQKNNVHKGSLMAFRGSDGKLLWQNAHDHPAQFDAGWSFRGAPSTPTVDGNSIYYITPACEVICADSANGKIQWHYDMAKELKVYSSEGTFWSTPPHGSPLVVGNLVFVITGNGRNFQGVLVAPLAPSFVALHKKTGKLAWHSSLPGENIIEGQWSSPTFAKVNGVPQVIFAGGDCVIYSFAPETGTLLWKCDCLPIRRKRGNAGVDNYIVASPVAVGNRLYVGLGVTQEHAQHPPFSYFLCLDMTRKGDLSLRNYDEKSAENKASALIWASGGPVQPRPKKGRGVHFGPTISTAAVHDGFVYIPENRGYLHCLDANTGRPVWEHDFKTIIYGSAYVADGRVFVGNEDGEVVVFAQGRTKKVLATIDMEELIQTTPVAANGVLYVATSRKLYAIGGR